MVDQNIIRKSAETAQRLYAEAARLSLDIESQVAGKNGPVFFLLNQGHREAVEAFMELATVDPTDTKKIRDLQFAIERYSAIGLWLSNAVSQGYLAWKDLGEADPELIDVYTREFSASTSGET